MQAQPSTFAPDVPFPAQSIWPGTAPHESLPPTSANQRRVARGHVVFGGDLRSTSAFQLVEGEIVIMRRGLAIDLIEAGEYVDAAMWSGSTTAVARTDCTLSM